MTTTAEWRLGDRPATFSFYLTAQALKAYSEREEQYSDNPRVEVVLLGAESIDAIKITHSNYFDDTADALGNLLVSLGLEPNPVPSP